MRTIIMSNKNQSLSTPVVILEAALKKEKEAYHFYDDLLQGTKVIIIQELLEKLRDEENKHILMIKKKLAKIKLG